MGLLTRKRTMTHDGMHSGDGSCGEKNVAKRPKTTVECLPRDLLVDVFARVASSSFIDVFNAKLCCKDFLEVGEDDYICQCISHDKFPIIHWFQPRDEVLSFQANCVKKGNPEALFRQGMVDYFNRVKGESGLKYLKTTAEKVESGLKYLKTAAEKGHSVAKYVYGMIMLSQGDEKALNLLTSLKCSTRQGYSKVVECRNRVESILWTMWIRNSISINGVNFKCQERDHIVCVRRMGFDEISAFPSCDSCMWSRELVEFRKILNRGA